jgi:hypothetical protein
LLRRIGHLGGDPALGVPPDQWAPSEPEAWTQVQDYRGKVNANLIFDIKTSAVVRYLSAHTELGFHARFFNYHSDDMCGQVNGELGALIGELGAGSAPLNLKPPLLELILLLGGIPGDGGGIGFFPNGGVVHVPPYDPESLRPETQDAVAGLLMAELASRLNDPAARDRLRVSALQTAAKAVEKLMSGVAGTIAEE